MECEFPRPSSVESCLNESAVGPGLDSDFGASAGTCHGILQLSWDLAAACNWLRQIVRLVQHDGEKQPCMKSGLEQKESQT